MKKFVSILVSLIMIIGMFGMAFAGTDDYEKVSKITEEELTNYAINFAKEFDDTLDLGVDEMIPIYNCNNILVGYSISYCSADGDIPYGYINLNFTYDDPVVEFVIQKNAGSIYEYMEETVQEEISPECQVEKKLYNTSALEYTVSVIDESNERIYYNLDDGEMNAEEFTELEDIVSDNESSVTKYNSHSDLFSSSYESGSTVISGPTYTSKYSKSKSLISQYKIMTETSKYACAVVALTEIANQEGILKNSSIKDTFNALWTATSTTETDNSPQTYYGKSITLGTTKDANLASGMKSYAKARGKTSTTTTTKSNPTFSFFKTAIDNNYSATLSYRIYVSDGTKSGHTVNVVGYCTAKKSGTTSKYLIVADGWYSNAPRYINYTNADFVNTYGVKYIIK